MGEERIEGSRPDMADRLERVRRFWREIMGLPPGVGPHEGLWHPAVDVFDCEDRIVVQVELPGLKGQPVNVSLEEDHLIIEGTRTQSDRFAEGQSFYCERPMGRFHRVIHLPGSVDEEATEAKYEDGVLTVTMPKAGRPKARRIEIA